MISSKRFLLSLFVLCLVFLTVFLTTTHTIDDHYSTELSMDEQQQWFDIASPITDKLFFALNNNNYPQFTECLAFEMKETFSPEDFKQLREDILSDLGNYISKTPVNSRRKGSYIIVEYNATFSSTWGMDAVILQIHFKEEDDTHKIYGFCYKIQ